MDTLYITPDENLQAVFDRAQPGDTVRLSPGVYRQKAVIRTPGLTLQGSGAGKTRLIWDDYARKRDPEGFEYLTFRSYTLAVCADGVTLENLAVINDSGKPEVRGQQIALSVLGTDFSMTRCRLSSTQDTLFSGPLPPDLIERYDGLFSPELRRGGEMKQLFRECLIEGTVDFIFGCGSTLFEDCEIRSLWDVRNIGYAAAPAHTRQQQEGFVFRRCRFTREPAVTEGSVYLARPWRDFGLAAFVDCSYEGHIAGPGFDPWGETRRDRTARFFETPSVPGRVSWVKPFSG